VGFEPAFKWKKGEPVDTYVEAMTRVILNKLKLNTPIALSTHRHNYVSRHSLAQAESGLMALDQLPTNLFSHHPDLIFLTSPELGEVLERGYFKDVFTGEMVKMPSLSLGQIVLSNWKVGDYTTRNLLLSAVSLIALLVLWVRQFLPIRVKKKIQKNSVTPDNRKRR